jgi:hypothetical protein
LFRDVPLLQQGGDKESLPAQWKSNAKLRIGVAPFSRAPQLQSAEQEAKEMICRDLQGLGTDVRRNGRGKQGTATAPLRIALASNGTAPSNTATELPCSEMQQHCDVSPSSGIARR